ncbi:hypothetical protein [Nocardioides sp. GXQ0305]|uniref:hypothetical protein n=1 Tax=Nocardioides sp. GXQ0305 TaxID=3423912 RepID=UPI003D7ED23D
MDLDQVCDHLSGLDGVREQQRDGRTGWYVGGRLVARVEDEDTLVLRCDFDERERLVDAYAGTFSVTPHLEAHMKVLADLRRGDATAIRSALTAAWELQRP